MTSLTDLLIYLTTLIVVYIMPGPDMVLILSTSLRQGPKPGLAIACGLALSRTLHVTLSAFGLAALLLTHPNVLDIVKWIGAIYLLWLAWQMVRAEQSPQVRRSIQPNTQFQSLGAALRRGTLTNLLNPKALIFCSLLLPQFLAPNQPIGSQYFLLGAILVGVGFTFDLCYIQMARHFAHHLEGNAGHRILTFLFAGTFLLAALRLVVNP